ncbi:MAG: hypothetical protein GY796_10760 [Chloroflexi bacterium]|nr:hypothetical protein [Chloroflexota bacterium]
MTSERPPHSLKELATVQERPFTSHTPLIGPLIVRFRTLWNSVAAKWYVRPLLAQQNKFNRQTANIIKEQTEWQIAQDREHASLTREVARLTTQIIYLNQQLDQLHARVEQLENKQF